MSSSLAVVERMTDRLARNLRDRRFNAVVMDSSTTTDRRLHPSSENGEEAKTKECDYVLLTQIVNRKGRPLDQPQPPNGISIGHKGPGVDASDPLRGSAVPDYREDLQINFALFRTDRFKPVLDTQIAAQPSGRGPDSLAPAMDRESSRVASELAKR